MNVPAPTERIPRSLAVAQCDHERARSVVVPGLFPAFQEKPTQTRERCQGHPPACWGIVRSCMMSA